MNNALTLHTTAAPAPPPVLPFGNNLKLLRKRRGRSQEEVAVALDVKRSSWSGYENGSAEPPFDLLMRISSYRSTTLAPHASIPPWL